MTWVDLRGVPEKATLSPQVVEIIGCDRLSHVRENDTLPLRPQDYRGNTETDPRE